MRSVDLTVDVPSTGTLQPYKDVTIQTNGLTTILPSSGFDAMERVNATININHNNQISYMKIYSENDVLIETFDFDDMTFTTTAILEQVPQNKTLVVIYRRSYGYDVYLDVSYSYTLQASIPSNAYYKIIDGNNPLLEIYNSEDMIIGEIKLSPPPGSPIPRLIGRTYVRDSYYEQAMVGRINNYPITTNGNINVPIPIPYSVVDQINLNVNVDSKIYIDRIGYEGGTFLFSTFSINTTDNYISVPSKYMFFSFVLFNNTIRYKLYVNGSSGGTNVRPLINTSTHTGYYIVADYSSSVIESVNLRTSNDENVILITDDITADSNAITGYVYRQFIDFVV